MKTIIAGCRDCFDRWELEKAISTAPFKISEVICGKARGVDTMGREWAAYHGLRVHSYPAQWKAYGNAAGPIRNQQMLDHPAEALLAVWDGKSRGTANMIAIAKARGIPVHIHLIDI